MKIIELLDKMATGKEVPKKIRVFGEEFIFEDNDYYSIHNSSPLISYIGEDYLREELNYEVEIVEKDKKIEKIDTQYYDDERYTPETRLNICMNYINRLIDEVNKLKGENK